MKPLYIAASAMLVGFGLGAAAIQSLHAQAKPPVYQISEIEITNPDAFAKEFAPKVGPIIRAYGGRSLAVGQNATAIEGEAPKARVAMLVWDSLERLQAYRNSPEYKEARKIGDKYAHFRTFALEGVAN